MSLGGMLPGAALDSLLLEMKSESKPLNNSIIPFDFCVYFYSLNLKLLSDNCYNLYLIL